MQTPLTLTDVEALAVEQLDPDWAEYFRGGSGREQTLAENTEAFARWRLRQRDPLRDRDDLDRDDRPRLPR